MAVIVRLLLALAPLGATVLFAWLTMDGYLNFGGGEKDIFLVLPLLLWSLVYLPSYLTLWWRRAVLGRAVALSSAIATGVVVVAWLVLAGVTWWRYGGMA